MTDAWGLVEGKASLEKNKYTRDIVYSVANTCNTSGADCKDGDKVFADRKTETDAMADLKTKTDDYNGKVTAYESEYEK